MTPETAARAVLLILGMVAFVNYRNRTLGPWLRAKFFNEADPAPAPAGASSFGSGNRGSLAVTSVKYTGLGGGLGALQTPVSGPVTSPFGKRGTGFHEGIDFGVAVGTPVAAARAGRVIDTGAAGGYGNKIDLDHGQGVVTRYAHLSRFDVRRGDDVAAGAMIGLSGNTGRSTGPHLHFELRRNGVATDPAPYLAGAGAIPALAGAVSA